MALVEAPQPAAGYCGPPACCAQTQGRQWLQSGTQPVFQSTEVHVICLKTFSPVPVRPSHRATTASNLAYGKARKKLERAAQLMNVRHDSVEIGDIY